MTSDGWATHYDLAADVADWAFQDLADMLRLLHQAAHDCEARECNEVRQRYADESKIDWSEEDPYWWRDVQGSLRVWVAIAVAAVLEQRLVDAAEVFTRSELGQGHVITRVRRALEEACTVEHEDWETARHLYKLRNILIHSGTLVDESDRRVWPTIKYLRERAPGFECERGRIQIEIAFCEWAIARAWAIVGQVLKDIRQHPKVGQVLKDIRQHQTDASRSGPQSRTS